MKSGKLFWITGLSGAGKTTIGEALFKKLKQKNETTVYLDGDIMKKAIEVNGVIDYTAPARKERAFRYAGICKMLTDQGIDVVCATISMYDEVRQFNRDNNKEYIEVFLDVPMEVLVSRNKKGLYDNSQGRIRQQVAGVDVLVEYPKCPDIVINNDGRFCVEECVNMIMEKVN